MHDVAVALQLVFDPYNRWVMLAAGPEKNRYRESDEVAKATR